MFNRNLKLRKFKIENFNSDGDQKKLNRDFCDN